MWPERPFNRRTMLGISTAATTAGLAGLEPVGARAQEAPAKAQVKPAAATPPARAEDIGSIEAITAALYDAISGPAGPRNADRIRSLFHPGARLIPCFASPEDRSRGTSSCRVLTVDEFLQGLERATREQGFFEREIARRVERFGAIAHVFSTYESRRTKADPQPFTRGINSIQLFFDGRRWWTISIFWDSERPDRPIPAEFLPKRP